MMANPTRLIIQNGTVANDGTGDTLRDAAEKINNNFAQLWIDTYSAAVNYPGRYYSCREISGFTQPDSGEFTVNRQSWDSSQRFKIHHIDTNDRKISYATDSAFSAQITFWKKDTSVESRVDDWTLIAVLDGNASYHGDSNYWEFSKTSVVTATDVITDSTDSNRNDYYIKLHGVW